MTEYPQSIQRAIQALSKLPGIGTKTAERLVFFFLRRPERDHEEFIKAFSDVSRHVSICATCGYVTDEGKNECAYCSDKSRNKGTICVVSDVQTVQTIEKSGAFKGLYHVLGGVINPVEGITADMLSINQLRKRISEHKNIKEVILATGTDISGEQTALYISSELKTMGIKRTRLARGIPRGSTLEYTDEITLADAIKERKDM